MGDCASCSSSSSVGPASGVFAPGHLGGLTRYVPFELVDDILAATGATQQRLRDLPSRVGVYFILAMVLFNRVGYARVWAKMVAGITTCMRCSPLPEPSAKALRDLRRRVGAAPLKALFEVLAGPLGQPSTPGVCWRGLRTVAFDGCASIRVPATARNWCWLGRTRYRSPSGTPRWPGYPTIRLMVLIETGTRGILGAVIGSARDRDEPTLAQQLFGLLRPGMLVLADRAFGYAGFITGVAATGADLLARTTSTRRPVVVRHLPDGSFLTIIGGRQVRMIEADVTVTGRDGSRVGDRYRLITTLLDHDRYPAGELVGLYHERWEIEIAFYAICHTLLQGHLLRSGDRPGLEQEIWAMLVCYQVLRMAMLEAIESHGRVSWRAQPGPGKLHHRPGNRSRAGHTRHRHSPRPRGSPGAGNHRNGRLGRAATGPPCALEQPQGQEPQIPVEPA